jgi:hypothetical protein
MGGMDEMNCDELVERVTDYFEDALDSRDSVRLDEHLQVCIGCIAHVGEVKVTLQLLSSLSAERLSDELESDLAAFYRRWAGSVST